MYIIPKPEVPNKPKGIHKSPCENCPSMQRPLDPEATDILNSKDKHTLGHSLFSCAWRSDKLCKGNYDLVREKLKELNVRHS